MSDNPKKPDPKAVLPFGGLEYDLPDEFIRKNIEDYPYVMSKLKDCRRKLFSVQGVYYRFHGHFSEIGIRTRPTPRSSLRGRAGRSRARSRDPQPQRRQCGGQPQKAAAVPPDLYGDDRAHDLPRQNEQDPVVLHPVHEGGCLFGESRQRRCQSFQSHAITPDIRSRYDPAPFNAP